MTKISAYLSGFDEKSQLARKADAANQRDSWLRQMELAQLTQMSKDGVFNSGADAHGAIASWHTILPQPASDSKTQRNLSSLSSSAPSPPPLQSSLESVQANANIARHDVSPRVVVTPIQDAKYPLNRCETQNEPISSVIRVREPALPNTLPVTAEILATLINLTLTAAKLSEEPHPLVEQGTTEALAQAQATATAAGLSPEQTNQIQAFAASRPCTSVALTQVNCQVVVAVPIEAVKKAVKKAVKEAVKEAVNVAKNTIAKTLGIEGATTQIADAIRLASMSAAQASTMQVLPIHQHGRLSMSPPIQPQAVALSTQALTMVGSVLPDAMSAPETLAQETQETISAAEPLLEEKLVWQKRLMHLTGEGDDIKLWIRDNKLSLVQSQNLVYRLASDIASMGMRLTDATINGKRAFRTGLDSEVVNGITARGRSYRTTAVADLAEQGGNAHDTNDLIISTQEEAYGTQ